MSRIGALIAATCEKTGGFSAGLLCNGVSTFLQALGAQGWEAAVKGFAGGDLASSLPVLCTVGLLGGAALGKAVLGGGESKRLAETVERIDARTLSVEEAVGAIRRAVEESGVALAPEETLDLRGFWAAVAAKDISAIPAAVEATLIEVLEAADLATESRLGEVEGYVKEDWLRGVQIYEEVRSLRAAHDRLAAQFTLPDGARPNVAEILLDIRDRLDGRAGAAAPPRAGRLPWPFGFVGRGKELDLSRRWLADPAEHRALVWCGDGGLGKSDLAAALAWSALVLLDGAWWLDGSDEGFDGSLRALAADLGCAVGEKESAPQIAPKVLRALSAGRHLLVLDNAESAERLAWFAAPTGPRLLATRRGTNLPAGLARSERLGPLERADAVALLRAGRPDLAAPASAQDPHRADLEAVCGFLGDHALAVAQAGGLLQVNALLSPARLLGELEGADVDHCLTAMGAIDPEMGRGRFARSVAATMALHMAALGGTEAARLLVAAAACAPERIPAALLAGACGLDDAAAAAGLMRLHARSIVTVHGGKAGVADSWVSAHVLTQRVAWTRAASAERDGTLDGLVGALLPIYSTSYTYQDYSVMDAAAPHALAVLGHETRRGNRAEAAQLANDVAGYLLGHVRYDEAERLNREALAMRRRLFEGGHSDLAWSLNNLAGVLEAQGRAREAEPLNREALEMRRRLFEGDHAEVATSLNNLALVLASLNRPGEAELLHREALAMRRRLFKGDDLQVARSLNNLASVLNALGRAEQAEPFHREALAMRRRLFPGDHPDVAGSLNNLAGVLFAQGRAEQAEPLYRKALTMYQRLFPGDHPDVATSLNNLAAFLYEQGRKVEARPLITEAAAMILRVFGPDHPSSKTILEWRKRICGD